MEGGGGRQRSSCRSTQLKHCERARRVGDAVHDADSTGVRNFSSARPPAAELSSRATPTSLHFSCASSATSHAHSPPSHDTLLAQAPRTDPTISAPEPTSAPHAKSSAAASSVPYMTLERAQESRPLGAARSAIEQSPLPQPREAGDPLLPRDSNGPQAAAKASPFAKSWAHFVAGAYVEYLHHPDVWADCAFSSGWAEQLRRR